MLHIMVSAQAVNYWCVNLLTKQCEMSELNERVKYQGTCF